MPAFLPRLALSSVANKLRCLDGCLRPLLFSPAIFKIISNLLPFREVPEIAAQITMLGLTLSADLAGVTDLLPVDTPEAPYYYTFKVVCTSCREEHANWVGVSRHDQNDMSGSRGEANFVWKCKNCKRESSATITEGPKAYEHAEPAKTQFIIKFDCRGCEFTDFKPDGEWTAKGTDSGSAFKEIDLSEGEWFDYDEKAGEEVSIKDIKWEIKRA